MESENRRRRSGSEEPKDLLGKKHDTNIFASKLFSFCHPKSLITGFDSDDEEISNFTPTEISVPTYHNNNNPSDPHHHGASKPTPATPRTVAEDESAATDSFRSGLNHIDDDDDEDDHDEHHSNKKEDEVVEEEDAEVTLRDLNLETTQKDSPSRFQRSFKRLAILAFAVFAFFGIVVTVLTKDFVLERDWIVIRNKLTTNHTPIVPLSIRFHTRTRYPSDVLDEEEETGTISSQGSVEISEDNKEKIENGATHSDEQLVDPEGATFEANEDLNVDAQHLREDVLSEESVEMKNDNDAENANLEAEGIPEADVDLKKDVIPEEDILLENDDKDDNENSDPKDATFEAKDDLDKDAQPGEDLIPGENAEMQAEDAILEADDVLEAEVGEGVIPEEDVPVDEDDIRSASTKNEDSEEAVSSEEDDDDSLFDDVMEEILESENPEAEGTASELKSDEAFQKNDPYFDELVDKILEAELGSKASSNEQEEVIEEAEIPETDATVGELKKDEKQEDMKDDNENDKPTAKEEPAKLSYAERLQPYAEKLQPYAEKLNSYAAKLNPWGMPNKR